MSFGTNARDLVKGSHHLQQKEKHMFAAMKDSQKLVLAATQWFRVDACALWASLVLTAIAVFWFVSSGSVSFILTLSSLVSTFSFLGVLLKVKEAGSAQGVSARMIECYSMVIAGRLCAIIPFEGYLPFDKSGDWLYQFSECCGLLLACGIMYMCRVRYAKTYDRDIDSLNNLWLILPALGISLMLHPHLNDHGPSDIAWAFALYLESVAVLCQFFMFTKQGKAHAHIAHFLAAQALSKFMSFFFWASCFSALTNPRHYMKSFVATWVLGMQMVQLLIMTDFIHNYLYCIWYRIPVSQVLRGDDRV